jgi:hypothetical protein
MPRFGLYTIQMHDPTPIGWLIIGGLIAAVAALPLIPAIVRLRTKQRVAADQKLIATIAPAQLWRYTAIDERDRGAYTFFVLNRITPGADFFCNLMIDGVELGKFESRDTTEAVFPLSNLNVAISGKRDGQAASDGWIVSSEQHGEIARMHQNPDWNSPRIVAGSDEYTVHLGMARELILRNGRTIGAYFYMPHYIHGVALDKTIPDGLKALLCNLIVRHSG